jgi:hypothetical protein
MGRRTKRQKQEFNFPTQDISDAELNSVSSAPKSSTEHWQKDAEEKGKQLSAVASIPEVFRPDQVEFIFDVLAIVLSFIYSQILKYDFKVIHEELAFDKEMKERLSIPLARICSKYAPSEWAGMTAEIELCTTMGIWMVAGFGRAKDAVQRDKNAKAQAAQQRHSNRVTQIPTPQQEEVSAIPL